jgi:hypothetical protein
MTIESLPQLTKAVIGQRAMQTAGNTFLGSAARTGKRKIQFYADFGVTYAEQNERDHAACMAAIRSGRVEASS